MMAENNFIAGLYGRMTDELDLMRKNEADLIKLAALSIDIVKKHIVPLREHILDTGFEDEQAEVYFFKETKPRFYRHLIYFSKVMHTELGRPPGGGQHKFLSGEQKRLAYFFRKYKELYSYLRSGANYLDKKFFLRKAGHSSLPQELEGIDKDPYFTTSHDFIIAKMSANDMFEGYLSSEIARLGSKSEMKYPVTPSTLSWTGSKASLTELMYALHTTGVFNHGNTSLQQMAAFMENVFNIRLGNYYRSFQEIRIRKKNRTQFMDELKKKLTDKMDYDDEFPR